KLLLCLFSLYLLVLAGIPCRADDNCCIEEVAANAARPQPAKGRPEYPQPCSPLFACGTCHGFLVPEYNTGLAPYDAIPAIHGAVYHSQPLPDFSPSIWQPPQIA
ncbi:MAG TPA: hypothetical protein VI233_08705, partial [Puia sp.]